jgi:hypothetical protein
MKGNLNNVERKKKTTRQNYITGCEFSAFLQDSTVRHTSTFIDGNILDA